MKVKIKRYKKNETCAVQPEIIDSKYHFQNIS